MGAKQAKPVTPPDNPAKADADLALQGMQKAAENFLNTIRLGEASGQTLGYPLTDQRLINQEIHLVVQTTNNAPKEDLEKAVTGIFSGDWKTVTAIVVDSLASFLGGDAPQPVNTAVNDEFSKSFLVYENANVVQYSIYVKRTNAKSVGTLLADSQATMISVICRGNIAYPKVDPQTILGALVSSKKDMKPEEVQDLIANIGKELSLVAQLRR
jgi:hypothetical protein